jgi:transcription elongation factor GreA
VVLDLIFDIMDEIQARTQFKKLINAKDYGALEALWLDLISQPNALLNLYHLFEVVQPLYNTFPEKASLFLSILTEHVKETGNDSKLLVILKETADFYGKTNLGDKDSRRLRKDIADCYRRLHPSHPNLESFIRKSELLENRAISTACTVIEQYLSFDIGSYVYSNDFGLGKVVDVDFLLDQVTVKFFNDKTSSFPYASGLKSASVGLTPLSDDNFLVLKHISPQILKEQVKTNPLGLFRSLLKSFKKPLKVKEIKSHLSGIVDEVKWHIFWEKIKKLAKNDNNIITNKLPYSTYYYSETRTTKSKSRIIVTKSQTISAKAQEFPEDQVLNSTKAEIAKAIEELNTFPQRKKFLTLVKEKRTQEWIDIYSAIFLSTQDKQLLGLISTELANFDSKSLLSILTEIFRSYRSYPGQFLWLAQTAAQNTNYGIPITIRFPIKSFLNRFLDVLSSQNLRSYWNECKRLIIADNYQFTKTGISTMSPVELQSFWNSFKALRNFEEFHKAEIKRIIQEYHPEVVESEASDVIYSTEEGIRKKHEELNQIMTVSIPQSAKEIGRAREFGDLSENYEYKAAKEKQAKLFAKVQSLRSELKRAKPINFETISTEVVSIGTKIVLTDLTSGSALEFTILGPYDINPEHGIISYLAPFAKTLLGKKVGDIFIADSTDQSSKQYRVVTITKAR